MFGLKKKKTVEAKSDDEEDDVPTPEVDDADDDDEEGAAAPAPTPAKSAGLMGLVIAGAVVTLVSAGGGIALGTITSSGIERAVAERQAAAKPPDDHPLSIKYSDDMVLQPVPAIVTNLASPSDTWVRLETSMVFKNGDLPNPEVAAAEVREDMLAYMRTLSLTQLEGPSALQHLREDLNERAALRTGGAVSELIIQTLVVQ